MNDLTNTQTYGGVLLIVIMMAGLAFMFLNAQEKQLAHNPSLVVTNQYQLKD